MDLRKNLLLTVIIILLVALILFALWQSMSADAPKTTSKFLMDLTKGLG
jgi:FtsZ-interacting cell division protein ZipA